MYDVFQALSIDKKEDIFTFCLINFFNNSALFRSKAAEFFGFQKDDSDYQVMRKTISITSSKTKSKIVPDLILHGKNHLAVIESKMFSLEGYNQSLDYSKAKNEIIDKVREIEGSGKIGDSVDVKYYYFTLLGSRAKSDVFETISWATFYSNTLNQVEFDDEVIELLRKAVLNRAEEYRDFEINYLRKPYKDITDNPNSWISPYSLFSEGILNDYWRFDSDIKVFNGKVNGKGHQEFRTDLYKEKWMRYGNYEEDNVYMFVRIEWKNNQINVFLNWEYWLVKEGEFKDYIGYKSFLNNFNDSFKNILWPNKQRWREYISKEPIPEGILLTGESEDMLHMMKAKIDVSDNKTISDIIGEIHYYWSIYEKYIEDALNNMRIENGYLTYNKVNK